MDEGPIGPSHLSTLVSMEGLDSTEKGVRVKSCMQSLMPQSHVVCPVFLVQGVDGMPNPSLSGVLDAVSKPIPYCLAK